MANGGRTAGYLDRVSARRLVLATVVFGVGIAGAVALSEVNRTHRADNWAHCFAQGYHVNGYGSACFTDPQ